jgi:hypothetical protein
MSQPTDDYTCADCGATANGAPPYCGECGLKREHLSKGEQMSNLTKFLHAMAEGISETARGLHPQRKQGVAEADLADFSAQLAAVAAAAEDGVIDWPSLDDRVGIDLEDEPERAPGGPAIVGGRLRLPGNADDHGYRWFDLSRVEEALGDDFNGPGAPESAVVVYTVEVPGREDGTFLFADYDAAVAFADAVSVPTLGEPPVDDPPVNVGEGAEDLIAEERAQRLEDIAPSVGDDVRERTVPLSTILIRLASIPETEEAKGMVGHWIEVDERRAVANSAFKKTTAGNIEPGDVIALDKDGGPDTEPRKVRSAHQAEATVHVEFADAEPGASFAADEILWMRWPRPIKPEAEGDGRCPSCHSENICTQTPSDDRPPWACLDCDAEFEEPDTTPSEPQSVEPAFTVLAVYIDNNQPYATSVYTHNGVDAAETLAQAVCREDNGAETGDDLLRIVGVIEGEHNVLGGHWE